MDFYRNWSDYKNGFGYVEYEHWLGKPTRLHIFLNRKFFKGANNFSLNVGSAWQILPQTSDADLFSVPYTKSAVVKVFVRL